MNRLRLLLALLFAAFACAAAEPPARSLAFVDVNVLPMDSERALPHQTVIVSGDTIIAVGPVASIRVPPSARRIAGKGTAWLLPGLADMHVHVSDEEDLGLFVAAGVTTVLHMGGAEQRLVGYARQAIRTGEVVGPQMFFSMRVDGVNESAIPPVVSAEDANAVARFAANTGYDFLKVYNNLSPVAFAALVDAGKRFRLPVIGHGVRAVGLPQALFQGQLMVAHAEEFLYAAKGNLKDPATAAQLAAEVKRADAFVTPALSTFAAIAAQWGKPAQVEHYLDSEEAKSLSPAARTHWNRSTYVRRHGDVAEPFAIQQALTLALQRAGVPLMTGTDAPEVPGMFPGASINDELRQLVAAGLTPFEALSAATRVPGEFIGRTHPERQRFGVVAVGQRADLVLVEANPLLSLETLREPLGVSAAGRWFDSDAIDKMLDARSERYDHLEKIR